MKFVKDVMKFVSVCDIFKKKIMHETQNGQKKAMEKWEMPRKKRSSAKKHEENRNVAEK